MSAAALKHEQMFRHLLASRPASADQDALTATTISLLLHASIVGFLLWASLNLVRPIPVSPPESIATVTITAAQPAASAPATPAGPRDGANPKTSTPPLAPPATPAPPLASILPGDPGTTSPAAAGFAETPLPGGSAGSVNGSAGGSGNDAFTVVEVMPALLNGAEVQRALERSYPPLLRDAGIGGTAQLTLLVDETGRVTHATLKQSSGQAALDDAALRVAPLMRFSPARNRDQRVKVRVLVPMVFRVSSR